MGNVRLIDRKSCAELRSWLGTESIGDILHSGRLRWYGHLEKLKKQLIKEMHENEIRQLGADRGDLGEKL